MRCLLPRVIASWSVNLSTRQHVNTVMSPVFHCCHQRRCCRAKKGQNATPAQEKDEQGTTNWQADKASNRHRACSFGLSVLQRSRFRGEKWENMALLLIMYTHTVYSLYIKDSSPWSDRWTRVARCPVWGRRCEQIVRGAMSQGGFHAHFIGSSRCSQWWQCTSRISIVGLWLYSS